MNWNMRYFHCDMPLLLKCYASKEAFYQKKAAKHVVFLRNVERVYSARGAQTLRITDRNGHVFCLKDYRVDEVRDVDVTFRHLQFLLAHMCTTLPFYRNSPALTPVCFVFVVLCCAMLCYAVLCCTVLCYAMLCCAVLYCAVGEEASRSFHTLRKRCKERAK
jgi:hypothetical protein